MFKDLQIQILEDVAETCIQVTDLPADSFIRFQLADNGRRIKRKRPEEMLLQLQTMLPEAELWSAKDLLDRLGWASNRGAKHSVGKAMALLGWKPFSRSSTRGQYYSQSSASALVAKYASEGCSAAEVCQRMGMEETAGNRQCVGILLGQLGWSRYKTKQIWRWKK